MRYLLNKLRCPHLRNEMWNSVAALFDQTAVILQYYQKYPDMTLTSSHCIDFIYDLQIFIILFIRCIHTVESWIYVRFQPVVGSFPDSLFLLICGNNILSFSDRLSFFQKLPGCQIIIQSLVTGRISEYICRGICLPGWWLIYIWSFQL